MPPKKSGKKKSGKKNMDVDSTRKSQRERTLTNKGLQHRRENAKRSESVARRQRLATLKQEVKKISNQLKDSHLFQLPQSSPLLQTAQSFVQTAQPLVQTTQPYFQSTQPLFQPSPPFTQPLVQTPLFQPSPPFTQPLVQPAPASAPLAMPSENNMKELGNMIDSMKMKGGNKTKRRKNRRRRRSSKRR